MLFSTREVKSENLENSPCLIVSESGKFYSVVAIVNKKERKTWNKLGFILINPDEGKYFYLHNPKEETINENLQRHLETFCITITQNTDDAKGKSNLVLI